MITENSRAEQSNALKNIDFLAWKINRDKRKIRRDEVNSIFAGRPRTRDVH